MNQAQTRNWPKDPELVFRTIIGRYAYLRERFRSASQVTPMTLIRNLPYYSDQFTGPGWALCGDAAFFVDPIHSSGVHMAFHSATSLAQELNAHLAGDTEAMGRYQRKLENYHGNVRYHVSLFYRLVKYYWAMYALVRLTGEVSNHWSGPWLRRVSAWSFGNYDQFMPAMRMFWGLGEIGRAAFDTFYRVYKKDPWGEHGTRAAPAPFEIPMARGADDMADMADARARYSL
jgi:2-polyprenyl-6-methoxyphenol hydroxylase-like FAD-dependent oxidoreductase